MSRYTASVYTCYIAELARDNRESAPEPCAGTVARRKVRWFQGQPYCHWCLLQELREHRQWQRERFLALDAKWNTATTSSGVPPDMTDAEIGEWQTLHAALKRQKERRQKYDRRYRRGELPWQRKRAA